MVKKVVLLTVCLLVFSGCLNSRPMVGTNAVRGSGRVVTHEFDVTRPITGIEIGGVPAKVNISSEKSDKITCVIDDNLLEYLTVEVTRDGILKINTRGNRTFVTNNTIVFNIGTDTLESITVSSAASINIDGLFTDAPLSLNISGAASINMTGEAENLSISVSGAANVNAREFITQDVKLNVNGAGSVEVYAAKTLDAVLSGVGSIRYWGSPEVTQSIRGLGTIREGN